MTIELMVKAWKLTDLPMPIMKLFLLAIADGMSEEFELQRAIEYGAEMADISGQEAAEVVQWCFDLELIVRVGLDGLWKLSLDAYDDEEATYWQPQPTPPPVQLKRPGYVYLIRSISGHYKIGRTVNPRNRLKTFNVKLPFEVEFEHVIECDDMVTLEKSLHERFAMKRVNGSEFFSLDQHDVEYIKGLAS